MIGNPNNTRRKAIEKAQRAAKRKDRAIGASIMARLVRKAGRSF